MLIYNIHKPVGQTPLETLETLRKKKKITWDKRLTYAGRLDPMAEGVLLILQNASREEKDKILSLNKTYLVEILFGFSTDSFDLLGLPKSKPNILINKSVAENAINSYFKKNSTLLLAVPPYSSVPYKGKPLFEWARKRKIKKINLPKREMFIKNAQMFGIKTLSASQLLKNIVSSINKVRGDFRQKKTVSAWRKLLLSKPDKYSVFKLQITCGSGTYIRSIADDLGKKLKTGAVVYKLKRLSVGKYHQDKSIKL